MSYAPKNLGFFDTIQLYFLEVTGRAIMFSGHDMQLLCRWREQGATAAVICRGIKEAVANMDAGEAPRGVRNCQHWIEIEVAQARERAAGSHDAAPTNPAPHAPTDAGHGQSTRASEKSAPRTDKRSYYDQKPAQKDSNAAPITNISANEAIDPGTLNPHHELLEHALKTIEEAGQACADDGLREVYREAWRATRELLREQSLQDPFSELAGIEEALAEAYFRALDHHQQTQITEAIAAENRPALALMSPRARQKHLAARRRALLMQEHGLTRLID